MAKFNIAFYNRLTLSTSIKEILKRAWKTTMKKKLHLVGSHWKKAVG